MTVIAVVEGDGIGREVIPIARDLIARLRPDIEFLPVDVGYGRWERKGTAITGSEIATLKSVDAILFGAVTTPPFGCYESVVVRIRKELDLYANVRPITGDGADIIVVRENTEGLYAGVETVGADQATSLRVITRKGSERIARFACNLAKKRRLLTIGHKANVLKSDAFFREICIDEATKAGIPYNDRYIDALCLDLLMHPTSYDVIVTENMFGDILSDVAAYLVGGLGMLPSANIGDNHALFEPVHGSAPDIAGRDIANPVAAIRSASLLLRYIGDNRSAEMIEGAVERTLASGIRTRDIGGSVRTTGFGDAVSREIGSV